MTDFTNLQEIAENKWQAKYHGNYGIYTVKLVLDANGRRTNFDCSCPSDYYPCKHIAMMEKEVAKYNKQKSKISDTLTIDEVLKKVSFNELQQFVIQQAKYNIELANALMLEFSHRVRNKNTNPYSGILSEALEDVYFDDEDYYNDYALEIEPLNEWLDKAKKCLAQDKYEDALLISQACIEEFADWYEQADGEMCDYIETAFYETKPFDILQEIVKKTTDFDQKLYDYCKLEMQKSKYKEQSRILDGFNDLMAVLAPKINPAEFIALQKSLLQQVSDKKSHKTEKILERMIQFYRSAGQPEKADEIVENNLQIENFCKQAVEKRIAKQEYEDAKRLIYDYLKKYLSNNNHDHWDEYILDIAQKEKDVPTIRKTAFGFISSRFNNKYYAILRSTYTKEEWVNELENLIRHYEQGNKTYWGKFNNRLNFNSSVADVLVAEKAAERLLLYLENNADVELVEKYYSAVAAEFPARTLFLFRKVLDEFSAKNLGRDKYEYVKSLLNKMAKIKDGEVVVNEMVANYRSVYKSRRAMLEILGCFK